MYHYVTWLPYSINQNLLFPDLQSLFYKHYVYTVTYLNTYFIYHVYLLLFLGYHFNDKKHKTYA